ncbi:hypothetical protein DP939_20015 [Spongiactinospora rosea]|uniref:Uncharacterized protein n=1 Tax=Spongiactinospora rosea TaxID=2248750 RepID=A0A366LW63_9ACTN|nr:hypothetical protein DP939_20015 [Spongiactinospora rosea]
MRVRRRFPKRQASAPLPPAGGRRSGRHGGRGGPGPRGPRGVARRVTAGAECYTFPPVEGFPPGRS